MKLLKEKYAYIGVGKRSPAVSWVYPGQQRSYIFQKDYLRVFPSHAICNPLRSLDETTACSQN